MAEPPAPQRLFDAHLHIVDPAHPLTPNQGYLPAPFTVADYRARTASLADVGVAVAGGAVVSGSFQGFDQGYLVAALAALGPGFVGVTQLPADVADDDVLRLHGAGVRAVRFNVARGGSAGLDDADRLARRVHDLAGWHAEFYVDARRLAELEPLLAGLPRVSVDHLGMHRDGLPHLLPLVAAGVRVKATGFGRVELDPVPVMRAILRENPAALLTGTDLPSTRARRPFQDADLALIRDAAGEEHADAVLWGNAAAWYGV